jgi:hypothetical protein
MKEGKLEIQQNGDYKNVSLTTKYKRNGLKLTLDGEGNKQVKQQGLDDQEYVVLTKVFAEGMKKETKYGETYLCRCKYNDEDVSFFLKPIEHERFAAVGGEGDQIKATNVKVKKVHPTLGVEVEYNNLNFEKVN